MYFYTLQWMSFHQLVYFSVSPESIAPWKLNSDLNCWHGIYNTIEKIPTHINAPTLGPKGPTDIHQPTHIPPIVSMIYTIPMKIPTDIRTSRTSPKFLAWYLQSQMKTQTDIHPPNYLHDIYNTNENTNWHTSSQLFAWYLQSQMKTSTDIQAIIVILFT